MSSATARKARGDTLMSHHAAPIALDALMPVSTCQSCSGIAGIPRHELCRFYCIASAERTPQASSRQRSMLAPGTEMRVFLKVA